MDAAREKHTWDIHNKLRTIIQEHAAETQTLIRLTDLVQRPAGRACKSHMYGFNNLELVGSHKGWAYPSVWLHPALRTKTASYDKAQEIRCTAEVRGATHVEEDWR